MKKLFLIMGLALILNANDFIDKLSNLFPEPDSFKIVNGTYFKIADDINAFIIGGEVKCYDDKNDLSLCTEFKNQDSYEFKVTLVLKDEIIQDIVILNENWIVKKIDKQIQVLRPNGFIVELIK